MKPDYQKLTPLLETVVERITISKSLYEKARDRHRSLGEWLNREASSIRAYKPDIRPQGSFRYGTVNRPMDPDDEFDLDNVCVLTLLGKSKLTQDELKHLYGEEIKAYARAHGMTAPVKEHNRCWRLVYADEVNFHLDTLPCVPEEEAVIAGLIVSGVSEELARLAVAITDLRHEDYKKISARWPSSNPRGFAAYFEQQAALGRVVLEKGNLRATIEDVPAYEWKTTLQGAIQILKRHRDVMFQTEPDLAPISMIITNLAARAYAGETNLGVALGNIVEKMTAFVGRERPWVPNPADPAEDYADKWARDSRLQPNFWTWHTAVKNDLAQLTAALGGAKVGSLTMRVFDVTLTSTERQKFEGSNSGATPAVARSAPAIVIPSSAPRPWGR